MRSRHVGASQSSSAFGRSGAHPPPSRGRVLRRQALRPERAALGEREARAGPARTRGWPITPIGPVVVVTLTVVVVVVPATAGAPDELVGRHRHRGTSR